MTATSTSIAANTASNGATSSRNAAPHRKNAAQRSRSDSPYQQRTTQRDNPTQLLIKQAVDYLIQQLEAGKSETLTAYLSAMARFHSYSFGNILQIARQRPTATRVAGIRTWNEMGRFVKKGEKGIQILAPMMGYKRRKSADGESEPEPETKPQPVLIGFRAVYVFDVAQTEGADLPEFEHSITGEVGEHRDRLIDFLAQQNIALEFNEKIAPALGVSYGGKIALLPGQSKAEEFVSSGSRDGARAIAQGRAPHHDHADRARDGSRGRGFHRGPGRWLGDGQRFKRLHPDVRGQCGTSGRKS